MFCSQPDAQVFAKTGSLKAKACDLGGESLASQHDAHVAEASQASKISSKTAAKILFPQAHEIAPDHRQVKSRHHICECGHTLPGAVGKVGRVLKLETFKPKPNQTKPIRQHLPAEARLSAWSHICANSSASVMQRMYAHHACANRLSGTYYDLGNG